MDTDVYNVNLDQVDDDDDANVDIGIMDFLDDDD